MQIPGLTTALIREHTAGGSFERGQEYLERGAIQSIEQVGTNEIEAHVKGNQYMPYRVNIEFDQDGITEVSCTCPYYGGSWCKHVAAVLLDVQDETVPRAAPASVRALVDDLDRAALVKILERLAEYDPELLEQIERESKRLAGAS